MTVKIKYLILAVLSLVGSASWVSPVQAQANKTRPGSYTKTPWVEADFPFYSSVLDVRNLPAVSPHDNLTPRGLILKVQADTWVCFDTDLLRISAVWVGQGVAPKAQAPFSYPDGKSKTPDGQNKLPTILGEIWTGSGIYPGWQSGTSLTKVDPREPAPSVKEIGRGPLPTNYGRFNSIELRNQTAVLHYTASHALISEWWSTEGALDNKIIQRHIAATHLDHELVLVVGAKADAVHVSVDNPQVEIKSDSNVVYAVIKTAASTCDFTLTLSKKEVTQVHAVEQPKPLGSSQWPALVKAAVKRSPDKDSYVMDHIDLPSDNPWQRKVRACDIQFFKNGTAAVVTYDGDVWLVDGLDKSEGTATWKRYASGLHEPMSLAIRDEQIYVFDKNGIWKLLDPNHIGEATLYELFSNAFSQTADMREFATAMRLAPDGSFVIAKGGQQSTTLGKHNGSVLRVSKDGLSSQVLGYGFRQPNIGVNPVTGLVTGSDQEGEYIPSTPIHVIEGNKFYGYLAKFLPHEKYPAAIQEPLTWMPHSVSASAMGEEWLIGAKMGPLTGQLVHIAFDRPELYRVILNSRLPRLQASVISITQQFDFPPLHGSVNPKDGFFYVTGFQVIGWGNVIDTESGLGRLRYTGIPSTMPCEVTATTQGVLIRFDNPLDKETALDISNYAAQSWHYVRTYKYGSPELNARGVPGHDRLAVSAVYLSKDERSVFIAIPHMKPVMQLQVSYDLKLKQGRSFLDRIYTTPYELITFDPTKEGFAPLTVDLTPKPVIESKTKQASVEEGKQLSERYGCIACHTVDSSNTPKPGPTWYKLFGRTRDVFADGKKETIVADEGYIRESIILPNAKYVAGYEKSEIVMPSFAGILTDEQIDSLIRYIKTLK